MNVDVDELIRLVVAAAPPLTDEQRSRIAAALPPVPRAEESRAEVRAA